MASATSSAVASFSMSAWKSGMGSGRGADVGKTSMEDHLGAPNGCRFTSTYESREPCSRFTRLVINYCELAHKSGIGHQLVIKRPARSHVGAGPGIGRCGSAGDVAVR